MKNFNKLIFTILLFGVFGVSTNSFAQEDKLSEAPTEFKDAKNIMQVVEEIDNYYLSMSNSEEYQIFMDPNKPLYAPAGTKWKEGEVK